MLLGARGAAVYVVGIAANLALARLLAPSDFGLVALGTVLVVLGGRLVEGGLGAALLRRSEPPTRRELEAVLALQLAALTAVAVVVAAVASGFGRNGLVIATMMASLPLATFRTPSYIALERDLRYRAIATADVLEALTYYTWAIATVALGMGVWGLATAVIVRAAVGSGTLIVLGPVGLLRPRWSRSIVRRLVGFGARFQLASLLLLAREQGLNVLVAAVAGLSTLGVWNLAWRVLQIPNLLFASAGRVAFPAMSRLIGSRHDLVPVLERSVRALAVLTGIVTVAMLGLAPTLPAIVGAQWGDVPSVILWSGCAVILAAPIVVPISGYLFAADEVGTVALATIVSSVVWFATAAALLPSLGAPAVGLGWLASAPLNAVILARRAASLTGASLIGNLLAPASVAIAAGTGAWLLARELDPKLLGGAAGVVAGELVLFAGLAILARGPLRDALRLIRDGASSFARRRPAEEPAGA